LLSMWVSGTFTGPDRASFASGAVAAVALARNVCR
jgi:hypothetical protein